MEGVGHRTVGLDRRQQEYGGLDAGLCLDKVSVVIGAESGGGSQAEEARLPLAGEAVAAAAGTGWRLLIVLRLRLLACYVVAAIVVLLTVQAGCCEGGSSHGLPSFLQTVWNILRPLTDRGHKCRMNCCTRIQTGNVLQPHTTAGCLWQDSQELGILE